MTTILVVDDEPDVEALITQKFRRRTAAGDLTLVFAGDGVEALETIATHGQIDLVLADINMPRMDGLTLLARMQEMPDPIATIIVSAYGDMANIRAAMNRGAFDFVTKPIDFTDLDATIAKTLRHVGAMRDAQAKRMEAERSHAALARYFSPSVAAALAADRGAHDLEADRKDVTSIFTDIQGFTSLAETLEPPRLRRLLNLYLGRMCDVVFAHGGVVAKILGDGLHVLFGAPEDQPDHAARAVRCALALDAAAQDIRLAEAGSGISLGITRIGVHSGPALVGDFGGGGFFDYTAYGDTINASARLEAANKLLGTRLCVSGNTAARIEGFSGRPMGDLRLRGRKALLRAFEPLPADQDDTEAEMLVVYSDLFESMAVGGQEELDRFVIHLESWRGAGQLTSLYRQRLMDRHFGSVIDV